MSERADHVLIVDGSDAVRKVCQQVLRTQGFTTTAAASGNEAVAQLRRGRFQLVIMEQEPAGLDGLELLVAVRKVSRHLPVLILVTDPVARDFLSAAASLGSTGTLAKPFGAVDLVAAVAAIRRVPPPPLLPGSPRRSPWAGQLLPS